MVEEVARSRGAHPLEDDVLAEAVVKLIQTTILKQFHAYGRSRGASHSVTPLPGLWGAGMDAEDILSETFADLLRKDPSEVRSWEALAVTIASRRAKDAWRKANRHLRPTAHREGLRLVAPSGEGFDGEGGVTDLIDHLPASSPDPEAACAMQERVYLLFDIAREILSERDSEIFLMLHCDKRTRAELGKQFGISVQAVGDAYRAAKSKVEAHPRYPYRRLENKKEGDKDGTA